MNGSALKSFLVVLCFIVVPGNLWRVSETSCAEFEPGLVTKIVDHYVAVNLGRRHEISVGDTLWVHRERDGKSYYVGLVRVIAVKNKSCGAEILFIRKGETIEILDLVGFRPGVINLLDDRKPDNLGFARELVSSGVMDASKHSSAEPAYNKQSRFMPSVILFTIGGIGVGVTAACAGIVMYHDYKIKYTDDAADIGSRQKKIKDFRRARNIAAVSSAAILITAAISHYIAKRR